MSFVANINADSTRRSGTLPFSIDTAFTDHKGLYKPRIEKRQRNLAEKLQFLQHFLLRGENILLATTATSPTSMLEQVATGMNFIYFRRCLLVFTDRRILHIPTTMGYRYRESIAQIYYRDIAGISQDGAGLNIVYKSGLVEQFMSLPRREHKKIRTLLPDVDTHGMSSGVGQRHHICPQCMSPLERATPECVACGLEFKRPQLARKLSFWLPGGGYFYTRHPWLGFAALLFEATMVFAIAISLIPTAELPLPATGNGVFFAAVLALEKAISIFHSGRIAHEFLPKRQKSAVSAVYA